MDNNVKYLEYINSDSLYYEEPKYKESDEFVVKGVTAKWFINDDDPVWKFYDIIDNFLPDQGWKIHISTDFFEAKKTLEIVSDILIEREIAFKCVKNREVLFNMYSKSGNRISAGKFITIYPKDNQFIPLMNTLEEKLRNCRRGPYILTDRQWKNSNVFYRYGGFKKIVSSTGELCIRDDKGNLVPDIREPRYYLPEFIEEPEELRRVEQPETQNSDIQPINPLKLYEIEKSLRFTNSGGIYVAKRISDGKKCVIKEARNNIGLDGQYRTAAERLDNEHLALKKLNGLSGIVKEIDYFQVWENTFLVEEFVEGEQFVRWIAKNYPFALEDNKEIYLKKVKIIMENLKKILTNMHSKNIAMCDLQSQNILINEDTLDITLIDFELASEKDSKKLVGMATKGYMHPLNEIASEKDWYALNRLFQYCYIPVGSVTDLDMRLNSVHCKWIYDNFGSEAYKYFEEFQKECCQHLSHSEEIFEDTYNIDKIKESKQYNIHEINEKLCMGLLNNCNPSSESLINGDIRQFESDCGKMNLLTGGFGAVYALYREDKLSLEIRKWIELQLSVLHENVFNDGFLTGTTGVACVLYECGYENEAENLMEIIIERMDYYREDLSFRSGLAGIGMALAAFYKECRKERYRISAEKIGRIIMEKIDKGTQLYVSDWDGVPIGLIDGYSGIAFFFTILYAVTYNDEYKKYSVYLMEKEINNTYISERDGSLQIIDTSKNRLLPYLAKGSIGIGVVITVMNRLFNEKIFNRELSAINKVVEYRCCFEPGLFDGAGGFFLCQCFNEQNVVEMALQKLESFLIEKEGKMFIPGKWFYKLSSDMYSGTTGILLALNSAKTENVLSWLPLLHKFF